MAGSATAVVIAFTVRLTTVAHVPLELADMRPQGPDGTREISLSTACNLMHCLGRLFTVRSCWHGMSAMSAGGVAVGGALVR